MEKSILENSKGATYMSFILDIEIVIKKDGTRANLAESTVKSKNQIPKKKRESTKGKRPRESPSRTVSPGEQNETKVYAMSLEPRNIFNEQENLKEEICPPLESDPTKSDKNNIPEDEILERKSDSTHMLKKHFREREGSKNHHKHRRLSKTERKAKVFKGKIEKIDFLECNRIFMCNYLEMVRLHSKNGISLPVVYKNKFTYPKNQNIFHRKSQTIDFKPNKLLKKGSIGFTPFLVTDLIFGSIYSSGDNNIKENLELKKQYPNLQDISSHKIIIFGEGERILDTEKNAISNFYSCQNVHSYNQVLKSTVVKKCCSLPNVDHRVVFPKGYRLDFLENKPTEKPITISEVSSGKESITKTNKIQEHEKDELTNKCCQGTFDVENIFQNNTGEHIIPQIHMETGLQNISQNSCSMIVKEVSLSNSTDGKSTTIDPISSFENNKCNEDNTKKKRFRRVFLNLVRPFRKK